MTLLFERGASDAECCETLMRHTPRPSGESIERRARLLENHLGVRPATMVRLIDVRDLSRFLKSVQRQRAAWLRHQNPPTPEQFTGELSAWLQKVRDRRNAENAQLENAA
jgi:hypothetical protein